ncbi:IS4 family transposase [Thiohalomonas denitrificans]|uniref:Transposase DDE domain-containing protein n=1 Tax=Thiohalomonas denitrificans TaxID=415747 RepID=A0A1G5QRP5_9GAMM|nr:IS4 family transposase [Thiohalomonas denitrificans]SCZ63779.1 Transposase DDE domain-containing protein [Thiohalomonas denitrificans]
MHATDILDTCLTGLCQTMHAARYTAVKVAVESALAQRCVTVTALGRGIIGEVGEKHCIKRMDRLAGNEHLRQQVSVAYQDMAEWILGGTVRPLILVDWSPLSPDERFHLLRASVPVGGRALAIYEEVHERNCLGSRSVQTEFLATLASLLPPHCEPILVTDAGFKNPWFRAVEALGWDWIGRIRGTVQITRPDEEFWVRCTRVANVLKTGKPTYLGAFLVARSNPIECAVYGLRKPPKGRRKNTRHGHKAESKHSKTNAAREREPWLIVTSLPGGKTETKKVLAAYRKRMAIEENFRDTKSEYYGMGLDRSRSRSAERYSVLLLINALALFTAWLHGKVAQTKNLHWRYQANTVKSRSVLSSVFLGLRVIRRGELDLTSRLLAQLRSSLCEPEFGATA